LLFDIDDPSEYFYIVKDGLFIHETIIVTETPLRLPVTKDSWIVDVKF
jgi:hypothetical protein